MKNRRRHKTLDVSRLTAACVCACENFFPPAEYILGLNGRNVTSYRALLLLFGALASNTNFSLSHTVIECTFLYAHVIGFTIKLRLPLLLALELCATVARHTERVVRRA